MHTRTYARNHTRTHAHTYTQSTNSTLIYVCPRLANSHRRTTLLSSLRVSSYKPAKSCKEILQCNLSAQYVQTLIRTSPSATSQEDDMVTFLLMLERRDVKPAKTCMIVSVAPFTVKLVILNTHC